MKRFSITLLVATALTAIFGAGQALAATLVVDNDKAQCPNAQFTQIQPAVLAAGPGDTVLVCPGTYPEQVAVPAGKNNLTLRSQVPLAAIIQAPPTIAADAVNFKSIVRITTSQNVSLLAFTVTGPGPSGCDSIRYGVRVDGGGSANIAANHITEIRDNPFGGCQNGVAILVGRNFEGQVGSARIAGNLIDKYQKNGPTVDGPGSSAVIFGNDIRGAGAINLTAQNGIQVSRGATAQVRENLVVDNAYIVPLNLPEFTATGILVFEAASSTVVDRNRLNGNQDGIGIYTTTHARISNNRVIGGISPFPPALGMLTLGDGIYAGADTSDNLIVGNFLRRNVEHDCHDDSTGTNRPALVANIWRHNDGLTENKPGLCRGHDNDDDDDNDDNEGDDHGDK